MASDVKYDDFQLKFEDDVAIIMMGSGENRIHFHFIQQMHTALDKVLQNRDVKAVITTGQGRFYSNGLDLRWVSTLTEQEHIRFRERFGEMLARILTFPLPMVAAVNGHAFAGGALLTLVHDHVIMQTQRGWWCMNEVHEKLVIAQSIIGLLRNKLYPGRTLHEVVVLGRRFTAEDALSAGIVHKICAPVDLMPTALSWIRTSLPKSGYDRSHLERMKKDVYKATAAALAAKL